MLTPEQLQAMGRMLIEIADEIKDVFPIEANALRNMGVELSQVQ